jgi:hypothetical protein
MYAVVRSCSGTGANDLFDLLEKPQAEVETIIRPISGFVSYLLIRTDDDGVRVTNCEAKTGTDGSIQIARD